MAHGARQVIARDDLADALRQLDVSVRSHSEADVGALAAPSEFRSTQFTSGSTGPLRSVQLDKGQLGANMSAILGRVQRRPGDIAVSWLPLSHDMGLLGMLLTGIAAMSPDLVEHGEVVLLDPVAFLAAQDYGSIRSPLIVAPLQRHQTLATGSPPNIVLRPLKTCQASGAQLWAARWSGQRR